MILVSPPFKFTARPLMGTLLLPVGKRQLNTINANENKNPCGNVQNNVTKH